MIFSLIECQTTLFTHFMYVLLDYVFTMNGYNIRERSGRVLDSRPRGREFEPHWRHCIVSLSENINPSLVLVQPKKTGPFITERLLMGRIESNQRKHKKSYHIRKMHVPN